MEGPAKLVILMKVDREMKPLRNGEKFLAMIFLN